MRFKLLLFALLVSLAGFSQLQIKVPFPDSVKLDERIKGIYTPTEKTKLSGIAAGATVNSADATLLGRANHTGVQAATTITEDATHRFATDAEKTTWNAKQSALVSGTSIKTVNGTTLLGSGNISVTATTDTALLRKAIADSLSKTKFFLSNEQNTGFDTLLNVINDSTAKLKNIRINGATKTVTSTSIDYTITGGSGTDATKVSKTVQDTTSAIKVHSANIVPQTTNTVDLGTSTINFNSGFINSGYFNNNFSSYYLPRNSGEDLSFYRGDQATKVFQVFNASGRGQFQAGGTFTDIPSARVAINSTTEGFLPPRMTATQRTAISSPATGLVVYDTDSSKLFVRTASAWASLGASSGSSGSSFPTQQSHTSGSTVTISNQSTDIWVLVNPSSTLSALTITMPATLVDGQKVEISFGGTMTTGTVVTSLTIVGNTGQTVLAPPTGSVDAGETISFRYKSSNTTLYRL